MYYVPDYEAWCAVVDSGSPTVTPFDFTVTTMGSIQEKAQMVVSKPGYQGAGLAGDVNQNGTLTIVDAQNASDALCIQYALFYGWN